MSSIIPPPFLFRYSFPVRRIVRLPKTGRRLLDLPAKCTLPFPAELDAAPPFGQVRAAWNEGGLGLTVLVGGKTRPPNYQLQAPTEADGLQVWIDTRNTQSIHRASRFCHHFCLLPAGGGREADEPTAAQLPIARAREEAPPARPEKIQLSVAPQADGYLLEAWLPAEVLHGFEPEANPRLGFYYWLRDAERGDQFLTVGKEFPFAHDPSLWSTLELTR